MRRTHMTRVVVILALVALVASAASVAAVTLPRWAQASPSTSAVRAVPHDYTPRFQDGSVLAAFKSDLSPQDISRIEQMAHAREVRTMGVGVHLLSVPKGQVIATVHLLESTPGVRYAEPNYVSELAATPNDPSFPIQWGYQNTGQTVNGTAGTPGDDEKAVPAWSVTTGSKNIVIGEVDTGVQYTHPDLAANIWTNPGGIGGCPAGTHGYNVLTSTCDPMDDDTQYGGHGTHVAGIMGAVGNNGVGVTGVNWNTTILPVKWVTASGGNSTSDLITALDWLIQAKQAGVNIRVINDSTVFVGTAYSQALSDEIDALGQNDILFVTAAGNTGDNNDNPAVRRYPCGYDRPNEICVAASDQNDALPSWANYGVTTTDLAAPGNNVYSTLRNSTYGFINGSSMASPQVAGAAALILSVQDMTAEQLKADILENVDVTPGLTGLVRSGGRLDICKALPGCVLPPSSTPPIGLSSVGGNSDVMVANRKRVNHYQISVGGTVSKLTMYLQPTGTSGTQSIEGLIYADQAGSPGALVATTAPITFSSTSSAGWYDMTFASPVSLNPGTYWIGLISGGTSRVTGFRWNSVSGARAINSNTYTSGPSNPFGSATIDSEQMSIYATFTPNPSPPPSPAPPVPFDVTAPQINGTPGQAEPIVPAVGQALNATTGVWDFSPTSYAFQWNRCSSTGTSCAAISGATGSTYVPVSADANGTLSVSVTATNSNGTATGRSEPTQIVAGSSSPPPSNTFGKTNVGSSVAPAAANSERVEVFSVGQAVSVTKLTIYLDRWQSGQQVLQGVIYADQGGTPGALLGDSNALTFTATDTNGWYDLTFPSPVSITAGNYWIGLIDGPTASVFALAYDAGPSNSSDVIQPTYSSGPPNPFGSGALDNEQISIYATYTASQGGSPPTNSTPPTISGTAQVGQALTATTGTWNNNPTTYAYQWGRCDTSGNNCTAISGATSSTYTLASADAGTTIIVSVTATNAAGSGTANSAPTGVVQTAPSGGGTFGKTNVGSGTDPSGSNAERVEVFNLGQSGTVTKLTIYLIRYQSGQQVLKGLIYADQGGVPGNLLGVSNEFTFSTTATSGWYDLTFPSPITLSSGNYWIGLIDGPSTSVFALAYNSCSSNCSDLIRPSYSSGPPNPFGSGTLDTEQISIYATYTAPQQVNPPTNVTPPAISGTAQVGQTLTASAGTWNNGPTAYAYQWQRCNTSGANCTAISGATAATYVPVTADAGSTLVVTVTASNSAGSASATSAATAVVQAAPSGGTFGKTNIGSYDDSSGSNAERVEVFSVSQAASVTKLTIYLVPWSSGQQVLKGLIYADQSGAPGALLGVSNEFTFSSATNASGWYDLTFPSPVTVSAGNYWIGLIDGSSPNVFALAYDSCSSPCSDLIRPSYSSGPPNPFGSGSMDTEQISIYATYTAPQPVVAPTNSAPPTISGTTNTGQTLTATTGTWNNGPTSYAYQWGRCNTSGANCTAISGATNTTYTLSSADVGSTLVVTVTASNSAGSASATSAATAVVQAAPTNTAPPTISGTTQVGQTLTATTGTWGNNPTTFAYQWGRCDTSGANCTAISGATAATYVPVTADAGSTLVVTVTATNSAGSASATSAATAVVQAPPANTSPPTISGTAQVGRTLTASNGYWNNSPTSYAYQWQRCDTSGANCTAISGATSPIYTLAGADAGATIVVTVTATNSAGSASASSAATAVVQVTATFGKTNVGSYSDSSGSNAERVEVFNLSQDSSVTKLTIYLAQWSSGQQVLKGVIYADQSGAPGSLVAVTNEFTFSSATNASGWYDLTFASPVSLTAGNYWIGLIDGPSPSVFALAYDACSSPCSDLIRPSYSSGPPNPFGSGSMDTEQISIYATYTAPQSNGAPTIGTLPTISGTAQVGQTLTATTGFWNNSPTSYAYQWQRCNASGASCAAIGGATSSTYTLASADAGATIVVTVTATNAAGSGSATSAATSIVQGAPANTAPPTITGTALVGQSLTASTGTWTFSPTSYAYQWQRCDTNGANCAAISGATSSTYTLASADAGSTIVVTVTASNSIGSGSANSAATAVVQTTPSGGTFGKTNVGTYLDPGGSNAERVEVFSVGQAVSVTKLTIYLYRWSSGQQVLKGLIYADQGGTPGALLATSNEFTFSTTATTGWYDLTFASPVSLSAGNYWIGLIDGPSTSVFALAYDQGPSNCSDLIRPSYSSGPPNPFGSGSLDSEQISIYATYS